MTRGFALLIAGVASFVALSGPAGAHGDLRGTSPEDGSKVGRPPERITVSLTEPPTRGPEATAIDGCNEEVPAAVSVEGNDIVLALDGGERGKWKVSYRAVSAVDGHQTRGKFSFTVSGKRDCSSDDAEEPDDGDDVDAADQPGVIENPDPPDEGISWLVWVGGGTVLLVALALVVRRSGS